MEIPDQVVIFGRSYEVKDISPFQMSEGILGQAAYRDGVIYVDHGTDLALMLTTLWHEAAHIAQQELHGSIDEAQARWIALFVHNLLLDNPDILECYLTGFGFELPENDEDGA